MAPGHDIETRPHGAPVRILHDGQVVAESDRALDLHETGLPPRLYVPREDVRLELLTPSTTTTHCPFKGDAAYFDAPGVQDVAWTYEAPIAGREDITGHLSFFPDKVQVAEGP